MAQEQLELEAQEAIDELWKEGRLPFKLALHRVEGDLTHGYRVLFFDSRLPPVLANWNPAHGSFKDAVREAVNDWASAENGG